MYCKIALPKLFFFLAFSWAFWSTFLVNLFQAALLCITNTLACVPLWLGCPPRLLLTNIVQEIVCSNQRQ
jgi:hypothetical protein